jgi:hypothetical protein
MSNVLVIRILEVKELASGDTGLMWVASDSYADAHSPTMSVENFAESYPTEHDLIMDVLQSPMFSDGVAIITDNTYELDACSGIFVEGYREAMGT